MNARVTWIRAGDRHFLALDEAREPIGVVRRVEGGPDDGRWLWSIVQVQPGTPFSRPLSGTTKSRREAVETLVATWREFVGMT